jgi:LPPG:FO 2-phospho-L-lactate transferase
VRPGAITVISNTGDDVEMFGLHVSPDIDIVIYHLAGVVDEAKGWGVTGDTFHVLESLGRFGEPTWFNLGDRDMATSVHRTSLLRSGSTLSEATASIAGAFGLDLRILPMSDDRVDTQIVTPDGVLAFQEYFVRHRTDVEVREIRFHGIESARPAPGVLDAIHRSDAIIVAPSNPFVSIAPVLAVPGVRDALHATRAKIAAISPIVGGEAIKGPAARMFAGFGLDVSPVSVARLYADFLDTLVIDAVDAGLRAEVESAGPACAVTDTIMRDGAAKAALAAATLQALDIPIP